MNARGSGQTDVTTSNLRFEPGWARIISGSDEGAYGWVAMNYQMGTLLASGAAAAAASPSSEVVSKGKGSLDHHHAKEDDAITIGALDLGGSSLEVRSISSASAAYHPRILFTLPRQWPAALNEVVVACPLSR